MPTHKNASLGDNNTFEQNIVCPRCSYRDNVASDVLCHKCGQVLIEKTVTVKAESANINEMFDKKYVYRQKSAKGWLKAVLLLAIASGALLFAGSVYHTTKKTAQKQESTKAKADAKTKVVIVSRNLEQFIGKHYLQVQEMAASPFLSDKFIWSAWSVERKKEYFQNNYLTNSDGVDNYVVMDAKTGDTVFSGGTGTKISNNKHLDYYQQVVKFKKPVVIPYRKSSETGIAYMYMAAPSFDEQGELLFITQTRIRLDELQKKIAEDLKDLDTVVGDPSQSSEFFLVDRTGRIIATEDSESLERHIDNIYSAARSLREGQSSTTVSEDKTDDSSDLLSYSPIVETRGLPNLDLSLILVTEVD